VQRLNPTPFAAVSDGRELADDGLEQLSSKAYDKIKEAIIACTLSPGAVLSQSQIESFVSMGKAPVRTALTRLRQEGLVTPVSRKGYLISSVTMGDVDNLFRLRMLLEPEATRLAAGRLTADHLRRLASLSQVTFERGNKISEGDFLRANKEFHLIIAHASGNHRLAKILDQLLEEGMRIIFLTMSTMQISSTWQNGHAAIHAALERHDGEAAARIARCEIEDGLKEIARAVLSHPTIAQTNIGSVGGLTGRR
jgi:DNA-binding GntR family transcriptional regulator